MKKIILFFVLSGALVLLFWPYHSHAETSSVSTGACRSYFNNGGYFFDDYENAEYQNGFLVIHLKLKPIYSDGRMWLGKIFLHKDDCTTEIVDFPIKGSQARPQQVLFSLRFSSPTHYDLWDDEQDIKMECPACSMDIPGTMSDGSPYSTISYSGEIDGGASFVHSGAFTILPGQETLKSPIIIIPGLLGTELNMLDQNLWPNIPKVIIDPTDRFLDTLAMNALGKSINMIFPGAVISKIEYPFGTFHYADLLTEDLRSQGYEEGKTFFLFNYDWRLGAEDISGQLLKKIEEVRLISGAGKVSIVAHSYGGLILKHALISNSDLDSKVDKVIFAGVPNLGTPEAARALVFGTSLDTPFINDNELFALAQNMPSLFELLPVRDYFKTIPGWFDDLTNPLLSKGLNYDQSKSLLLGLGKNPVLIQKSEDLHSSEFDSYNFAQKPYPVYNISSCGKFTIKTINKLYTGSTLLDKILHRPKYQLTTDTGDGTVLLVSAKSILGAQNLTYSGVVHNQLLSAEAPRKAIVQLLTGGPVSAPAVNCGITGKLVALPSNLDITFFDAVANKTLKPGEDLPVKRVGEDNFVFLSDNEFKNYTINLQPKAPTSQGEKFSFNLTEYKDTRTKTYYYDEIKINKDNTYKFDVRDNAAQFTVADANGQSSVIPPIIDEQPIPADLNPPVSAIYSQPSHRSAADGKLEILSGDNAIMFVASDAESGLSKIEYEFDDSPWREAQSGESISLPDQVQTILFFALDKSGNYEDVKTIILNREAVLPPEPILPPAVSPTPTPPPSPEVSDLPEESNPESDPPVEATADSEAESNPPVLVNINVPSTPAVENIRGQGSTIIISQGFGGSSLLDLIFKFFRLSTRLIFF